MQKNPEIDPSYSEHRKQNRKPRILIVEDDFEMCKMIAWTLRRSGYNVLESHDSKNFLRHIGFPPNVPTRQHFDLLITDNRMPGVTGLEAIRTAAAFLEDMPVFLITAFPDQHIIEQAGDLGIAKVFAKPFDMDELLQAVITRLPIPESTAGNEKKKVPLTDNYSVKFPLDIILRHSKTDNEFKRNFVKKEARRLNPHAPLILRCRMVIDESRIGKEKSHHYEAHLSVFTAGRTIAVTESSDRYNDFESFYRTVEHCFSKANRRLLQHVEKQTEQRCRTELKTNSSYEDKTQESKHEM